MTGRNILIVTTQRSGSTWLMQTLNRAEGVRAYGEVFLEGMSVAAFKGDPRLAPPAFFDETPSPRSVAAYFDLLEKGQGRVAFKAMYDQVRRNPAILWQAWRRGYLIVHLVRENSFDLVTSRLLARKSQVYHSKEAFEAPRLDTGPADVLGMIGHVRKLTRRARLFFRLAPFGAVETRYEEFAAGPEGMARVLSSLGVTLTRDEAKGQGWTKTNRRSHAETYTRFAEIEAALKAAGHGWMIDPA